MSATITYLRAGRQMRATGTVIEQDDNRRMKKVKPARADWGIIWITEEEFAAGQEKPPIRPREKKDGPEKPKRVTRKPKAQLLPKWKQLVEKARDEIAKRISPDLVIIDTATISGLIAELEAAHADFLPLQSKH